MSSDDEIPPASRPRPVTLSPSENNVCVCFRVPLNKLVKHIRLTRPRYASQLSECYGAGTGCGWCIPFLEKIFEEMEADPSANPGLGLDYDEYLRRRREYHKRIDAEKMRDAERDPPPFHEKSPEP